MTKRKAAILKFSALAMVTLRKVIVARYDAILNQSERAQFYNHQSPGCWKLG